MLSDGVFCGAEQEWYCLMTDYLTRGIQRRCAGKTPQ